MNEHFKYDIINPKIKILRIDIMNRNAIISLAMLYALWQSKRQDILDLISPFILYAVGVTTKKGDAIDVDKVCACMVEEFGYRSFQPIIVNKILIRLIGKSRAENKTVIEKRSGKFYLMDSLDRETEKFVERRGKCKIKSDAVTVSLSKYLNDNNVRGRANYTQEEAEKYLLTFFEENGNSVLSSVADLHQIMGEDNEIQFFIARYILEHNSKKSIYFDYIVELVKGYFVTTALYLQAENPNITTSTFKDVTFYLDTAVLLALLGYKSQQENTSVQEMVKSLKKSGARIACFAYNISEIENILNAYRLSKVQNTKRASTVTLEHFDGLPYPSSLVDAELRSFQRTLFDKYGIVPVDPIEMLEQRGVDNKIEGLLDDEEIKTNVRKRNPDYNLTTLPDDIQAINAISRVREGKNLKYIEKCKAVFVTKNTVLVAAVKQYFDDNHIDSGFPVAISDSDLCVIAWLKDFKTSNNLPKMRLLENVLAVITPNQKMMDIYFTHIEEMERRGELSNDEATLLRIDLYAKNELMNLTHGNIKAINEETVIEIRNRMRASSYEEGLKTGRKEAEQDEKKKQKNKQNELCVRAEKEVEEEFKKYEKYGCNTIKVIAVIVAIIFIVSSIIQFVYNNNGKISYTLLVVTLITTVQAVWPFFRKRFWATDLYRKWLDKKKIECIDKRKKTYLSVLD